MNKLNQKATNSDKQDAVKLAQLCFKGHGERENAIRFLTWQEALNKSGEQEIAKQFLEIALEEIKHLTSLNKSAIDLGFSQLVSWQSIVPERCFIKSKINVKKILIDAICVKSALIEDYEKAIKTTKNEQVKELFCKIIREEKAQRQKIERFFGGITTFYG